MNSEEPQPDDVDDSDLPQQEKDEGDECDSSPDDALNERWLSMPVEPRHDRRTVRWLTGPRVGWSQGSLAC